MKNTNYSILLFAVMLSACGGGGGTSANGDVTAQASSTISIPVPTATLSTFTHPIIITSPQLEGIISRVKNPSSTTTKSAYDRLAGSSYASLAYSHQAFETVTFVAAGGSLSEDAFRADATAARAHVLLGIIKDDQAHINKAITIMNAWAATMKKWSSESSSQPQLETAWALPIWIAAADLLAYYNEGQPGWKKRDISSFNMPQFKKFALLLHSEASKAKDRLSNWGSSANLAMISYGAFIDDIGIVTDAIKNTKNLMSYMSGLEGLNPEVCRDTIHPQYTNVGLLQIAEISHNFNYKLGNDAAQNLYNFKGSKSGNIFIPEFLEYYSKLFSGEQADPCAGVWTQPGAPSGGYSYIGEWKRYDLYAIGYNNYIKRAANNSPVGLATFKRTVETLTPTRGYTDNHFILWGLVTHGID